MKLREREREREREITNKTKTNTQLLGEKSLTLKSWNHLISLEKPAITQEREAERSIGLKPPNVTPHIAILELQTIRVLVAYHHGWCPVICNKRSNLLQFQTGRLISIS